MGTRAELVTGYPDLDAGATGRYTLNASQAGTVQASKPCPIWLITNTSDSATIYFAPARGFSSANPAVNPAAISLAAGETKTLQSPQAAVILFNPAGNQAATVEVQAWR